ncbi:MAG TPA: hypothetical protein VF198_07520 [Vicinamibacterales bacterium]
MRATAIVGVVLIVLGLAGLLLGGFSYTRKDEVLDLGAVEATVERRENVRVPPVVSGLVLAAGVALLFVGRKGVR